MSTGVCRVCLVSDVKIHSIDKELQEVYEKLTSTKLSAPDCMPKSVCYLCYSQLRKFQKLSAMALQSDKLLRHQITSGNENVSHNTQICPVLNLRKEVNLCVTIAQSIFVDEYSNNESLEDRLQRNYICIKESASISVKIEIDVKKETLADAEDLVKTEQVLIDDDIYYDSLEETGNILKGRNFKNTQFSCDVCKKKYGTKKQMHLHMRVHRKDKQFTCNKCHKTFNMAHNLKKHMNSCPIGKSNMACSTCNETFSNVTNLKRHMRTHSEERPFICDRCSNKFKTRTHLKVHMRIHGGERPFACDVCSKAFTQISNLKTHMKIHEGTKPFACEICGKAFLTNGTLKSHMRCHSGERPFTCNTCGMTFGFKCSLNQHIRRLHTEVKAYPCSRCHLSFNHEVGLSAHMRAHTAERAFPCDKCSKAFTSARNLKGHNMQVHSGERPHSCNKCGKAYKRPEHLRQHFKSFKCKSVSALPTSK